MRTSSRSITIETKSRVQLLDITRYVEQAVKDSGVASGICLVHVAHATAGIIANENESGLTSDFLRKIEQLFPWDGDYMHNRIDDNAASHLAAGFIGNSRTFPIEAGRLRRGTWQNILLVELDGPRSRRSVEVTVIGE